MTNNDILEQLKRQIELMAFVEDEPRHQFSLHTDGYNQAIEEVIDIIDGLIRDNHD